MFINPAVKMRKEPFVYFETRVSKYTNIFCFCVYHVQQTIPSIKMIDSKMSDDELLKNVGACLKAARLKQRLTQEKLAKNMGYERGYISKVECGHKNASVLFFARAANAMGISLQELFSHCP